MLLGLPLGVIIGLLPGLSGITAFAFLIPFTFGMSPLVGIAFLLAAYAAPLVERQFGNQFAVVPGQFLAHRQARERQRLTFA